MERRTQIRRNKHHTIVGESEISTIMTPMAQLTTLRGATKRVTMPQSKNPPVIAMMPGGKKNRSFSVRPNSGHSREQSSKTFEQCRHMRSPLPSLTLCGQ
jgi:hypothetical protein